MKRKTNLSDFYELPLAFGDEKAAGDPAAVQATEAPKEEIVGDAPTRKLPRPMLREWLRAKAALGFYDGGGWRQDLCLYYDSQWDLETGQVGPFRYFISPPRCYRRDPLSNQACPFDCREIPVPPDWTVGDVERALHSIEIVCNCGSFASKSREFVFRTLDIPKKTRRRHQKMKGKFGYADRTANTGKIVLADGVRFRPAAYDFEPQKCRK